MKDFKELIGKRIRRRVYDLSGGMCSDLRRIITEINDDGCTVELTAGKILYGYYYHNELEKLLKDGKVFTPLNVELKLM